MDRLHRRFCLCVLTLLLVFCWIVCLRKAVPRLAEPLRNAQTVLLVISILGMAWAGLVEMLLSQAGYQPVRFLLSVTVPFGLSMALLCLDQEVIRPPAAPFLFIAYTLCLPFLLKRVWQGEWDP